MDSLTLPDGHPDRQRHKQHARNPLLRPLAPRHADHRRQVPYALAAPRPRLARYVLPSPTLSLYPLPLPFHHLEQKLTKRSLETNPPLPPPNNPPPLGPPHRPSTPLYSPRPLLRIHDTRPRRRRLFPGADGRARRVRCAGAAAGEGVSSWEGPVYLPSFRAGG